MKLKDKIALITGGSKGIGKEIVYDFLASGAKVVICDREGEKLTKVAEGFKKNFEAVEYYAVDISSKVEVDNMFEYIVDKLGTIDILVNNAEVLADAQLYKMTEEQWDKVINVNLKGTFNCCSAAVKIMREKNYGKIINISSIIGIYGNFGQANYSAAKAGMIGMTKSMATELGKNAINVNTIVPGFIETDMIESVPERILKAIKERTPLKRLGLPSDVAKACTFLASDDASFITGAILEVTGGFIS